MTISLARATATETSAAGDSALFSHRSPLRVLPELGVGHRLHEALDKAAGLRQMVAALGPKGIGKSVRLSAAVNWFALLEKERAKEDQRYAPQTVRVIRNARHLSYDDALISLLQSLDRRTPIREQGRRRSMDVVRQAICALLDTKRVAALVLDECEVANEGVINAVRDVAALSADLARERQGDSDEEQALGVGILFVGSPDTESVLRRNSEFGQRLVEVVHLPALTIAEANRVLQEWLPLATEFQGAERLQWNELVRTGICRDRETVMRYLANLVREYARRMDRAQRLLGVRSWSEMPVDLEVLREVAADLVPPDLDATPRKRRARRA
ncbi:MAG TPA: AAA family ATPase [Gemmatimonadales bacterium]